MKKKFIALLSLMPTLAMSCQVKLTNNSPYPSRVSIIDLNAQNEPPRFIKKGQTVDANFDPDIHARLKISIGNDSYMVEQQACSKNHTIPLTTSDVKQGIGGDLLKITKSTKSVHI